MFAGFFFVLFFFRQVLYSYSVKTQKHYSFCDPKCIDHQFASQELCREFLKLEQHVLPTDDFELLLARNNEPRSRVKLQKYIGDAQKMSQLGPIQGTKRWKDEEQIRTTQTPHMKPKTHKE